MLLLVDAEVDLMVFICQVSNGTGLNQANRQDGFRRQTSIQGKG